MTGVVSEDFGWFVSEIWKGMDKIEDVRSKVQ